MIQLIIFLAFLLAIYLLMTYRVSSGRKEIQKWAKEQNYELIRSNYQHVNLGPFHKRMFLTGKGYYRIFYIEVKDQDGYLKTGWARLGGYFTGLISEKVEVIWEKKS